MPGFDSARFRELCGHFATGVAVVTARDGDGAPAGMTANSFASVSLEPPLISISIDHAAEMHRILSESDTFVVNILEASQESLSRRFADAHPQRFEAVDFWVNRQGVPDLGGTLATLECEVASRVVAGDHTLLIARVLGGETRDGRPLLYFRGRYADGGPR